MEHRAAKFVDLAENLVDTYQGALDHALEGKSFVSEAEIARIYEIIKSYMPKMKPVFATICEGCPAYIAARKLQASISRGRGLDMANAAEEVIDFIITLSRQTDPVRNRVFLMAIADFSNLYCRLSSNGRLNCDERIRHGLMPLLQGTDRMIYVGSGVFLFFFEKATDSYVVPKKQAILETVFDLVGEKFELHTSPGTPQSGTAAEGASLIDVAFKSDLDLERHMKQAIDTLAATIPRTVDGNGNSLPHLGFDQIAAQLSFHYAPLWDARSATVALYRQEVLREIEPGLFLHGEDALTRKRGDEFHYRFELYKINQGFSALLAHDSRGGVIGKPPSLLVPLSVESLIGVSSEQFEADIHDIIGFHSGERLALLLEDIDEHIPRNQFVKVLTILRKRKVKLFCNLAFSHSYFPLLSAVEGMVVCLDVRDVLKFGFEIDIVENILQEFARHAKTRHVQPMITHVDSSTLSGIAYKSGYAYIAGKVVGETRASMSPVTEVPASRILLKS